MSDHTRLVTESDWDSLQSRPLTMVELTSYPNAGSMAEVYRQCRLDDLDGIVRREVAKALRAFATEQQQYIWQPGDTRRLPEDEQAAYVVGAGDAHAVVERLADKRADEIQGGQS